LTGSEFDGHVYAARRRSPERAATCHGCTSVADHDMNPPTCLPDQFVSSIYISFAFTRSQQQRTAAPPSPSSSADA